MQLCAYKGLLRLPLGLEGTLLGALSSVPFSSGGGVTERVADGATQPDDEAVLLLAASCRYSSFLMVSVGRDSNGLAKRVT